MLYLYGLAVIGAVTVLFWVSQLLQFFYGKYDYLDNIFDVAIGWSLLIVFILSLGFIPYSAIVTIYYLL